MKNKILKQNNTFSTLVDLLRYRADMQKNKIAYIFLVNKKNQELKLTYGDLDKQARSIAAELQKEFTMGERALLLYPPGLEFISAFFGCLYAGIIAVPVYPPNPASIKKKMEKLNGIISNCQPQIALTTLHIRLKLKLSSTGCSALKKMKWIASDNTKDSFADNWKEPDIKSGNLAFLQYTSGSTGEPKGVMVSHGNLIHNSELIKQAFGNTEQFIGVGWLPFYHDMGLIGNILQPVYIGAPCILMPPMAFLQKPVCWLQAISKYKATTSGGPNFAYELCVKKVTPEQIKSLDLTSWKAAFNASEPIYVETFKKFAETFKSCGFQEKAFYPCYGLAEATLAVSGGLNSKPPIIVNVDKTALTQNKVIFCENKQDNAQTIVGSGRTWLDQKILIVDPETLKKCPPNKIGEIWVKGQSVAKGYWNNTEQTEKIFNAYLLDTDEGPFLRTGDLGFMKDAELFVTGRIKDLIIIRGKNHYPQDIEFTVGKSHPAFPPGYCAAFSIEKQREEKLVIVQEVRTNQANDLNKKEAIENIRRAVAEEHQLEVYAIVLIRSKTIPKTSSGKIRRKTSKQMFLKDNLKIVKKWQQVDINQDRSITKENKCVKFNSAGEVQNWLITKFSKLAKIDPGEIDENETLSSYGLDSLAIVEMQSKISSELGITISEEDFFNSQTISKLSQKLFQFGITYRKNVKLIDLDEEYYNFELNSEYLKLQELKRKMESVGSNLLYFNTHEEINNNTTIINGQELINYSSYNYIGCSGHPFVSQIAKNAIDRYGTSVSASRLISGEIPLHQELEKELANIVGTEDAMVYVGGHATNVTVIGHLFGKEDLVLHDALIHNSVLEGCLLSGAIRIAFPHNDWKALDKMLCEQRGYFKKILIIIEGVYSMDGDIPDLPKFIEIKNRYKCFLMIDEAHSFGVLGETGHGIGEYFGVNPANVDIWMGTLSKSLASCGGYIAGSKTFVEYLKYTTPGFVYSVGISPQNTGAALGALRLLKKEPERVNRLHKQGKLFLELANKNGLNTGKSKDTPVIPIIIGNSEKCVKISCRLFGHGINVHPIIHPAVPETSSRLRFFINCTHSDKQIEFTIKTLLEELKRENG
ncbi:Fatty acyl-AMP ligase [Candidatus Magnetomoraceae bacterium gMMP-15]